MRISGSINVLEPPQSRALTTLAMVQASLGGSVGDIPVDMLTHLLNASSDFICTYCGREFARQKVEELLPGDGLPDLLVSITPIVTVEKVELDSSEYTDYTLMDKEMGCLQRRGGWTDTSFYTHYINDAPSGYAERRWKVTYTGGYNLPGWTGTPTPPVRTLPYDLERACLEIIRSGYKQAAIGADPAMTMYKIGETQASWKQSAEFLGGDVAALGIPPSALGILQHYRRAF